MASVDLEYNQGFKIYNANGTRFNNLVLHKATYETVVMSLGDKISGIVYYKNNKLVVNMTEYIMYKNVKYVLVNPPTVIKEGLVSDNGELKGMTKYSFTFYHPMYMLSNFPFSDVAVDNSQKKYLSQNKTFSWIGNLTDYVAKLNKNLEGTQWKVSIGTNVTNAEKNKLSEVLSFDNNTIADALKTAYETWEIPYIIDQTYEGNKRFLVRFGLPNNEIYEKDKNGNFVRDDNNQKIPFVFKYGQGVGLKNNSRTPKNNKIVTRIAGYGSEDNIPYGYPQIVWTGNQSWNYTINNDSTAANSYPIYDGIVGGQKVRLIKHPFTRTHLMPSIYSETVNKKVNPNATGYNPNTELVDYYDANDNTYPNQIKAGEPSYEIHEFEDIKPEFGSFSINSATPYDGHSDESITQNKFLSIVDDLYTETDIKAEKTQLNALRTSFVTQQQNSAKGTSGNYEYDWSFKTDGQYKKVKYASSGANFEYVVNVGLTPATIDWDDTMDEQGNYVQSYFKVTIPALGFDLYASAAITQEMTINMRSGACIGCSFPVMVDWDDYKRNFYDNDGNFAPTGTQRNYTKYPNSTNNSITLILQKETNTFGTLMPNIYQKPASGNKFVILGISLPTSYITTAEGKLETEMKKYMRDNNVYYYEYPLKFDEHFLISNEHILSQMKPNVIVNFEYADVEQSLYIKQMSIKYNESPLPKYDITLTDDVDVVLNKIGEAIAEYRGQGQNGNGRGNSETLDGNKFLRKDINDTASGTIRMLKGLQVGERFVTGLLGEGGIFRKDDDGTTYLECDRMYVRMKAYFDTVEVRRFLHSGGNRIASAAGMKCSRVEYIASNGSTTRNVSDAVKFRCYFRAEDNGAKVTNDFVVGDLAYCKETNIDTNLSQHGYWRAVVGVSSNANSSGEHWIDLSKSDCSPTLNDVPIAQDDIIQLGNKTAKARQGAIVEYVSGEDAPSYQIYQGINTYNLDNKNYIGLGYSSDTGRAYMNVYGDMYVGDKNQNTYIKYEQKNPTTNQPKLTIKAVVEMLSPSTGGTTTLDDFASAVTGDIDNLQSQIDGQIETWFYDYDPAVNNAPASNWTTVSEKDNHLGDLFYNTTSGYAWRWGREETAPNVYEYKWYRITDVDVVKALADAAKAQDTADHKRRVFTAQPYPPYDVGDLWSNAIFPANNTEKDAENNKYYKDLLTCKTAKAEGGSFAITDWGLTTNYTDDTALTNFVANTYAPFVTNIQGQVDQKAETWYQDSNPATAWYDATQEPVYDVRAKHIGDIWMDTSANGGKQTYIYQYNTSTANYEWKAQAVPKEVFDYADGKCAIYVNNPTNTQNPYPTNYHEKDMWILPIDGTHNTYTIGGVEFKAGEVLFSSADSTAFVAAHWSKKLRYTGDERIDEFIYQIINGASGSSSQETVANAINAVTGALNASPTLINGGLVLTTLIGMRDGNNNVWSGISGLYKTAETGTGYKGHGIAAWYGGGMADWEVYYDSLTPTQKQSATITDAYAKSLFRFDGSGYLAGGNITWDAQGRVAIKDITTLVGGNNTDILNALTTFNNAFHFTTSPTQQSTILNINPQYAFSHLEIYDVKGNHAVATTDYVNENFVTKAFFNRLFQAYSSTTTTDANKVSPNEATAIDNLKILVGAWTDQYLSAKGINPQQSGGGGSATLAGLDDVELTSPVAGQTLVYRNYHWVNENITSGTVTGIMLGTTLYSPNNGVVTLPAYPTKSSWDYDDRYYISNGVIHLGSNTITPLTSFTETDPTVPSWAKASTKPSYTWDEITSKPTTLAGYGITDAVKGSTTWWGRSIVAGTGNNPDTVSGDLSSVGNISFSSSGSNIGGLMYFDTTNGRVGIGVGSPSDELHVNGNLRIEASTGTYVRIRPHYTSGVTPYFAMNVYNSITSETYRLLGMSLLAKSEHATPIFDIGYFSYRHHTNIYGANVRLYSCNDNGDWIQTLGTTKVGNVIVGYSSGYRSDSLLSVNGDIFTNRIYFYRPTQNSDEGAIYVEKVTVDNINYLKLNGNFYATGSVSALGANTGGGGGGGVGDVTWDLLASNTDQHDISLNHISLALSEGGYATQSWVGSQGFLNSIPTASSTNKGSVKVGNTLAISSEVLNLATVTIGTPESSDTKYTKVVVDSYGRVTKATTLSATDIPSLAASKITSGTFDAARIPDLSATYATSTRVSTLEGNFTGDVAKSALKLSDNTSYTVWGQTFFNNGKPVSVANTYMSGVTGINSLLYFNNSFVGIGTDSPEYKLHVDTDDSGVVFSTNDYKLRLAPQTSANTASMMLYWPAKSSWFQFFSLDTSVASSGTSNILAFGYSPIRHNTEIYGVNVRLYGMDDSNNWIRTLGTSKTGHVIIGYDTGYRTDCLLNVNGNMYAQKIYLYKPSTSDESGAVYFYYDIQNQCVVLNGNFAATGAVSAKGVNTSGGGGGGGGVGDVTWDLLASSSDTHQIAKSHLTDALSGYLTSHQTIYSLTIKGNSTNAVVYAPAIQSSSLNIIGSNGISVSASASNGTITISGQSTSYTVWGKTINSSSPTATGNMTGVTNINSLLYLTGESNAENVGIGTDSPTQKLDVNGNLKINGTLTGVTSIDSLLHFDTTNNYVGIGVSSPSSALDVNGKVTINNENGYAIEAYGQLRFNASTDSTSHPQRVILGCFTETYQPFIRFKGSDGTVREVLNYNPSNELLLGDNTKATYVRGANTIIYSKATDSTSLVMAIKCYSGGRVGIGDITTSYISTVPSSYTGSKLIVRGDEYVDGSLAIGSKIYLYRDSSNSSNDIYFEKVTENGVNFVKLNGNFYATGSVSALGSNSQSGGGGAGDVTWDLLATQATNERYIHQSYIQDAVNSLGYATQSWVTLQGYLTSSALSSYVTTNTTQDITAKKTFTVQQAFTVASGSPFTVTSSTVVTNLNADKLDGQDGSYYATASSVTTLQGYFTNGVANSAAKLSTVSKVLFGNTYWTSEGIPTSIGYDASHTANLNYVGNIDSLLYFDTANSRIGIGSDNSSPAYTLDVRGNIRVGTAANLIAEHSTTSKYMELSSAGNEILISGAGSSSLTMHVNYRTSLQTSKYVPVEWQWHNGSSDSWTKFILGSLEAKTSIKIGGATLTWVSGQGLKCDENFYSEKAISALDSNSQSGGGGVGDVTWDALATTATGGRTIHHSYIDDAVSSYGYISQSSADNRYVMLNGSASITGDLIPESTALNLLLGSSSCHWTEGHIDNIYMNSTSNNSKIEIAGAASTLTINATSINNPAATLSIQNSNDAQSLSLCSGGGNVGIGTSPNSSYKLYVNGNTYLNGVLNVKDFFIQNSGPNYYNIGANGVTIYQNGTWTGGSDIRRKNIVANIGCDINQIASAPIFDFIWKADITRTVHVGTSAQYWSKVFENAVSEGGDGYLYMDYGATALASAVITARKVLEHEGRIRLLEIENQALRKEIEQLKANLKEAA